MDFYNTTYSTAGLDTGVEDAVLVEAVLFPNPARGTFHIQSDENISNVTLIDVMGRQVKAWQNASDQYDIEGLHFFLNLVKDNPDHPMFAIEVNGEAVGGVGLHPQKDIYSKNAEIGYWISEDYWGKGIMTKVIKEMLAYGWENLEIDRVVAIIFGTNVGSIKVAERCGFVLEATLSKTIYKFGEYEDELIYAIRRPV